MNLELCIDANLVVTWYAPEEWRTQSIALLDECSSLGASVLAPDFIFAEVASSLRRKVYRGLMQPEDGLVGAMLLTKAAIEPVEVRLLIPHAWRIAETHGLPTVYDACYLALAEERGCDFWTADERLINATGNLPYIKHIKGYVPGSLGA